MGFLDNFLGTKKNNPMKEKFLGKVKVGDIIQFNDCKGKISEIDNDLLTLCEDDGSESCHDLNDIKTFKVLSANLEIKDRRFEKSNSKVDNNALIDNIPTVEEIKQAIRLSPIQENGYAFVNEVWQKVKAIVKRDFSGKPKLILEKYSDELELYTEEEGAKALSVKIIGEELKPTEKKSSFSTKKIPLSVSNRKSSTAYNFIGTEKSQLGALLGRVIVDGIDYKGSIQKSDLPEGKTAIDLFGTELTVILKGPLQKGQAGEDYYKLQPVNSKLSYKFHASSISQLGALLGRITVDEREYKGSIKYSDLPLGTKASDYIGQELEVMIKSPLQDNVPGEPFYPLIIKNCNVTNGSVSYESAPLYEKARNAKFVKKDIEEAEILYKESIEKEPHKRISSVPDLISILQQKGKNIEALEFLEKYRNEIREAAYDTFNKQLRDPKIDTAEKIYLPVLSSNIGFNEISQFFVKKIDDLNLATQMFAKQYVKDGTFIQNQYTATKIINGFIANMDNIANDASKSDSYFAMAKLIKQVLSTGNSQNFMISEKNQKLFQAMGIYTYGNSLLLTSKNPESIRFAYLQTSKQFTDTEENIYYCWLDSIKLYISSFNISIPELRPSKQQKMINKNGKEVIKWCTDDKGEIEKKISEIIPKSKLTILTKESVFVVGLFEIIECINKYKKNIVINLWKNDYIRKLVIDTSNTLTGIPFENENEDTFFELWNKTSKKYFGLKNDFIESIRTVISYILQSSSLNDEFEFLRKNEFRNFLSEEDLQVFDNLLSLINKMISYHDAESFDSRSELLESVFTDLNKLIHDIEESPTSFSYDCLIPSLFLFRKQVYEEAEKIYKDALPDVTWDLSGDCTRNTNTNTVTLTLAFRNKENHQNIDFTYEIFGDGVISQDSLKKQSLRGDGRAIEQLINLKLDENIIDEDSFSLTVKLSYEYKASIEGDYASGEFYDTKLIHFTDNEFEEIENKYEQYADGGEIALEDEGIFYGRKDDIENILRQITKTDGSILTNRCMALYGQTRTGKSSLRVHLADKLRKQNANNIVVDIGNIGDSDIHDNDISDFLGTIIKCTQKELRKKHIHLYEKLKGEVLSENDIFDNKADSLSLFKRKFGDFCDFLEEQNEKYSLIFLIDEFTYFYDWIRQGTMTDKFMQFWKAFIQNYPVFVLVIGQDHMMQFVNQYKNEFGTTFKQKVTYLDKDNAMKFMDEPMRQNPNTSMYSSKDVLEYMYELTAGSAYLIMKLCNGLVEYLNREKISTINKALVEDFLKKNLFKYFDEDSFQPLYEDNSVLPDKIGEGTKKDKRAEENKQLLLKIARASGINDKANYKDVCINEYDGMLLKALQDRDVIEIEREQYCRIKVGLYKMFLLRKYGEA